MKRVRITKKGFLPIIYGVITIFLVNTISSLSGYSIVHSGEAQSFTLFFYYFYHSSYLFGGITCGWFSKKRGWIFGGISALIFALLIVIINQIQVLLTPVPSSMPLHQYIALQIFLRNVNTLPLAMLLGAVGGWIGEIIPHKEKRDTRLKPKSQ